jgi:hypothetical protein
MERRKFTREFKLEAVRACPERKDAFGRPGRARDQAIERPALDLVEKLKVHALRGLFECEADPVGRGLCRLSGFSGMLATRASTHGRKAMEQFVRRENIKHYREMLARTTDESDRRRLQKLLDEELQKQKPAGDTEPPAKRA